MISSPVPLSPLPAAILSPLNSIDWQFTPPRQTNSVSRLENLSPETLDRLRKNFVVTYNNIFGELPEETPYDSALGPGNYCDLTMTDDEEEIVEAAGTLVDLTETDDEDNFAVEIRYVNLVTPPSPPGTISPYKIYNEPLPPSFFDLMRQ